jgi:basic membrane protein A
LINTSPVVGAIPDANIAIVFSTGGLGDQSFNDAANEGKIRAIAANPGISVDQFEPTDITGINTQVEAYAAAGSYDLIIAVGFQATDGINASALAHPTQQFMIIDSEVDLPNVASVVFKEHEGSFLAGAMAAMVSENDDIAFLGGLDIPLINRFLAGYQQGARYINPDIIIRHTYSPDPSNPWGDQAGGKTVAESFIAQGSDIIYAAAGGTGLGVMDAAEVATIAGSKTYAIGVDSDQDHLKPGIVLTSMLKRVDVAVETQIQAIVDGTWTSGLVSFGLKEDGVGISNMTYTTVEKDTIWKGTTSRYEFVQDLKTAIINGTISVSDMPVKDANIAIVYSGAGLNDQAWNDMAKQGLDRAVSDGQAAGGKVTLTEACTAPCFITEITTQIESFAAGSYDLIIGVGFEAVDGITASAQSHPDKNFVILDSYVDLPNVKSVTFQEQEGSFLAGALAAMVTKTNDIAFLGGLDIPLIHRFLIGFEHGARYIKPDITVRATYSPDPNNPWNDLTGGKAVAKEFFNLGSDILYVAAGKTGNGGIEAAKEHNAAGGNKVYTIGVDADQDHLAMGDVLTSMIKRFDVAVEKQAWEFLFGMWTTGHEVLGIAEGGVGLSDMTYTNAEKQAIYQGTQTRWDKIEELMDMITTGLIMPRFTLPGADIHFLKTSVKLAIVYNIYGLGDAGQNDAAKQGVDIAKTIATNFGTEFTLNEACTEPCTETEITSKIESFAASENNYDLIIGVGFSAEDGIRASAQSHPDKNFLIIDAYVDLLNVLTITFKEQEGSFLAGAMAAMVSSSNDIAFIGGVDLPLINRFLAGFEHGARYIKPGITVRATYSPDPNNPWNDFAGGKSTAQKFIDAGSDIIFAAAGLTGLGVIEAVKENNAGGGSKVYAIGVDVDQDGVAKGDVLTSMIKNFDVVARDQLANLLFDMWAPGHKNLGLKENGVGISDMTYTSTEKNAIFSGTQTRWMKIQELSDSITSGTLTVHSTLDASTIIFGLPVTSSSPPTTTSPDTTSTTTDTSTDAPEVPIHHWSVFLGMIITAVVFRRKKNLDN